MEDREFHIIKIYRRSCVEWFAWGLWLLLLFFLIQNALASLPEHHFRAGVIFWAIFLLFLLGGISVFALRRANLTHRLREKSLDKPKR